MDKRASLSEFKKWMSNQGDLANFFNISMDTQQEIIESLIGSRVKPKVSKIKLLERIETDEDPENNIEDFIENGGTIAGIEGKMFYIETDNGCFALPRFCVKYKKHES